MYAFVLADKFTPLRGERPANDTALRTRDSLLSIQCNKQCIKLRVGKVHDYTALPLPSGQISVGIQLPWLYIRATRRIEYKLTKLAYQYMYFSSPYQLCFSLLPTVRIEPFDLQTRNT